MSRDSRIGVETGIAIAVKMRASSREGTVKHLLSSIALIALVFGIAGSARAQEEISLLALQPTPIRSSIDKLIPGFEAKTGYKVKVTYGSGTGTKQQAAKGEPFDVYLILPPYPDALASGNLVTSSKTTLANFILAVAVKKGAPKPDISSPAAVKSLLLNAKAVSAVDPAQGSAGIPVGPMLQKLGIAEQVQPKLKLVRGGPLAQTAVANGESDLCLLYLGDMENPGIDVVGPLSTKIANPTPIVGFVSTHAKNPKAAKALLAYLSSRSTSSVYKATGLQPVR